MASTINADTSAGVVVTADTSGELQLQSAGSTKATLKSDGKVGIGTTSPSELLSVSSGNIALMTNTSKINFGPTGGSGSAGPYGLQFYDDSMGIAQWYFRTGPDNFSVEDDGSAKLTISATSGDVANINNSYGAISDIKVKQDIVDASSQWQDIKNVKVRKYKLKDDVVENGENAIYQLGVIAQELESSGMSGLVDTKDDYDENDQPLGTTTKQVKYSVLYMKALKALQEAMIKIESLEARVTALESN